MFSIAIVEDNDQEAEKITGYLAQYSASKKVSVDSDRYASGTAFLNGRHSKCYDILFMDIQLPDIDGMTVCEEVRKDDSRVEIVFVTNMAQFAIKGYKVDALDFILKPVGYYAFSSVLERALARVKKTSAFSVTVKTADGMVRLSSPEIKYVEVVGHKLIYHTLGGDVVTYGRMKEAEDGLKKVGFVRISRFYLVNLKYVRGIRDCFVETDEESLPVSIRKKKEVLAAIADFFGGGGKNDV